ncbi:ABC transporter permease [Microbacterium pseudoresistens]
MLPLASTATAVLAWEVLARAELIPSQLSSPSAVVPWLWTAAGTAAFWDDLAATMFQWLIGLLIATVAGIGGGLLVGTNRVLSALLQAPIEFLRPIPAIIYLPLLLLLFGATPEVAYWLAAVGAVWPVFFQTVYGLQSLDPLAMETARMFGFSRRQRIFDVLLPGVAPSIATGVRIAASIALVVVVTVQIVGSIPGIGATLRNSQINGIYPAVYGLTLVIGGIGLMANLGMERLEPKLLKWHQPYRPAT